MKQEDYDREYGYQRIPEDNWLRKKANTFGAVFTKNGFKKSVLRRVPFARWISNYHSGNLVSDLTAGVTVGIYNVPQAMSYSTLAGLPPVYGLYASFFPPLLYSIFGTASHTSIGVFSVTCLMVNKCLQKMLKIEHDASLQNSNKLTGLTAVGIVTSLCLLTGIIQLITAATTASYFLNLEKNYRVKTIHDIPTGFPDPAFPRVDIWNFIVQDALSIAIVAYAVTISMGQIFSKKHKYRLDSNQELLALGLINIGSSFFATFPTSASLSRTLVNEECGAKTQLSGIISSICIFFVITFIGPLLSSLPSCVLAAIVLVAVKSLLMKYQELPKLWKYSKHDFETSFRIIRFDAPLIFANVDKFLDNVRDAAAEIKNQRRASTESSQENQDWTALIFDCHTWCYTDSMGIDAVREIDEDLKNLRVLPVFANLKSSLRRQYEHAGLTNQIAQYQMYPSIQDALDAAHELAANKNKFVDLEKSALYE
uniref:STAS domain-containing protein n=1 Tax=Caenorhabditis japonica TaxID=281687 RepID=A0A8R1DHG3_CAEJA